MPVMASQDMSRFIKVRAKQIGVYPSLVAGAEDRGPVYLTWEDSPVVGAQCGSCQTVVWCDSRSDSILNEKKPKNVPESGPEYHRYYQDRLAKFLGSLPVCPECQCRRFDRFINNVEYQRFSDGTPFSPTPTTRLVNLDSSNVEIWYLAKTNLRASDSTQAC
jgi:hypothetical protein